MIVSESCIHSVVFDVNDGPVIEGVYPPSILLPAESENMLVQSAPFTLAS